jgi:RND family efflux transporter MFP subunit
MTEQVPDAHGQTEPELPKPWSASSTTLLMIVVLIVVGLAVFFVVGYLPRHHEQSEVTAQTSLDSQVPVQVRVAMVGNFAPSNLIHLPGSLVPQQQTLIYARATGYVKRWLKDLGQHVQAGELLAELSAPDVDAQLAQGKAAVTQANAQVEQAVASMQLAKLSVERLKTLGPKLAAQQDIDNAQAAYVEAVANVDLMKAQVAANVANVQHLQEMVDFERIVAPFDGVITARFLEVGNLVTAGNGQQLFQVSQLDPVRIFIDVPQAQSTSIRVKQQVVVMVREFGSQKFIGTVTHIAQALDPNAHTMSTEITLPNPKGQLFSGMYAMTEIAVPDSRHLKVIPANALMLKPEGSQVAVVQQDGTIHYQNITIDIDTGKDLGVSSGLTANDRVVLNPNENLVDGMHVEILHDEADAGGPGGAAAPPAASPPGTPGAAAPSDHK